MPSLDRYFSDHPIEGDEAILAGPEAHHLVHVMRAKPGTQVVLFDGCGAEFLAEVQAVGRGAVRLTILSQRIVDRELPREIILGAALPKGDRQKWLVEKAVELGVQRIIPLVTERSVAQPTSPALDRLRRHVIEASKQCGRNRLMEVAHPLDFATFVRTPQNTLLRWIAHPNPAQTSSPAPVPEMPCGETVGPVWMAVGPEGGFTEEEIAAALHAGWQPVTLGPRILRVETAAIFLVALFVARNLPGGTLAGGK